VRARWLIVLVTAAVLVGTPVAIGARPVAASNVSAVELARLMQGSAGVAWSGYVETSGTLQVPDSDAFVNLAQLLGENNRLRVWWRSAEDWRVDRIRSTGETDLFRQGQRSVRWVFESERATVSRVSEIRLPDASDLLPPTLARALLQGVRDDELSRLPTRRLAGIAAPGVRLVPADTATALARVDLWADPQTGLPLRVELYGNPDQRAVLTTTLREVNLESPEAATTEFFPHPGTEVVFEESVDVAAAANAYAPFDLPSSLAGLMSRSGEDPGAVGIYGRGPTTLIALPLRGQVAGPLRQRLRDSAAAEETSVGTLAPVGPVGLLVTPRNRGGSFLVAGTVTSATLQQAAAELLAQS
jgi:hypothetical protein